MAFVAAIATVLALVVGCFSEHQPPTATSGLCNIELGEAFPGSTVVVIRSFTFEPFEVRVRAGERVTWINCDQEAHTSTADNAEWASGLLAAGQSFTQTFAAVGQFDYFCEPHPFMTGVVIVE
ncbi:MAG TPA: cupredoxin family copper-binding protein [Gemmatimonadales bacterium]|nr:cupredoxin family copper-binding protein [Gemmatimonadales bacterium]